MEYRGKSIHINEQRFYGYTDERNEYMISNVSKKSIVYSASCVYGKSFATNAQDALLGAEKLIDDNLQTIVI